MHRLINRKHQTLSRHLVWKAPSDTTNPNASPLQPSQGGEQVGTSIASGSRRRLQRLGLPGPAHNRGHRTLVTSVEVVPTGHASARHEQQRARFRNGITAQAKAQCLRDAHGRPLSVGRSLVGRHSKLCQAQPAQAVRRRRGPGPSTRAALEARPWLGLLGQAGSSRRPFADSRRHREATRARCREPRRSGSPRPGGLIQRRSEARHLWGVPRNRQRPREPRPAQLAVRMRAHNPR